MHHEVASLLSLLGSSMLPLLGLILFEKKVERNLLYPSINLLAITPQEGYCVINLSTKSHYYARKDF